MGVYCLHKNCLSFYSERRENGVGKSCCQNYSSSAKIQRLSCFTTTDGTKTPQEQIHFGISLEFTIVAKWNARFIKKKSQSVKKWYTILSKQEFQTQTSVRSDRESSQPPDPAPLLFHCWDNCSWRHDGQDHPPRDFYRSDWRVHHPLDSAIMLQLRPRHWPKGRGHLIRNWPI